MSCGMRAIAYATRNMALRANSRAVSSIDAVDCHRRVNAVPLSPRTSMTVRRNRSVQSGIEFSAPGAQRQRRSAKREARPRQ